jgi:hypothetical protein
MGKIWKKSRSSSSGSKLRGLTIHYGPPSPRNPSATNRRLDSKTQIEQIGRSTR